MEHERGQVVPLVALVVLVGGVAIFGLGRLGADAVGRARVRTAADAAALAAAVAGEAAAREAAEANGGTLDDLERAGVEWRAEVTVGSFSAVATARVVPSAPVTTGAPVTTTEGGG